jgi:MscS family membrane protein
MLASPADAQPKLREVLGGAKDPVESEAVAAAAPPKPAAAPGPDIPSDELDRGTPRGSVQGFLSVASEGDFEKAAKYLDLRNLPRGLSRDQGPDLARQLKIVLDRALWIDLDLISVDPQGHGGDGLPSYRDRVGRIAWKDKSVELLLQRVPRDDGARIWKFASPTVAKIPKLYEHFGDGPIGEAVAKVLPAYQFLGMQIWQWLTLLALIAAIYVATFVPTALIARLLRRRRTDFSKALGRLFTGPVRLVILLVILSATLDVVRPSLTVRAIVSAGTLSVAAFVWLALRLLDLLRDYFADRFRQRGQEATVVLLRPAANAAKIVTLLIAILVWLDNIGYEVTTLIAGLGIGGLAVALAAQKSLENLIGGIVLYVSHPVRVGDFCAFGDKLGTVEEIGLRATLVRTLDDTLVSVPNAEFSSHQLDNYSKRRKIWYHPRIRVRYETTPDQIRYILVQVRAMLYAHPKVDPDPARIRFVEFGAHSLDLDVFAYISVTDYGEYLEVAEDLNLRIMDTIKEAGTRFAVPVQATYVESPPPPDVEHAQAAESQVRSWRENNQLYLPSFPQERIKELAGSLAYPPTGSPQTGGRA